MVLASPCRAPAALDSVTNLASSRSGLLGAVDVSQTTFHLVASFFAVASSLCGATAPSLSLDERRGKAVVCFRQVVKDDYPHSDNVHAAVFCKNRCGLSTSYERSYFCHCVRTANFVDLAKTDATCRCYTKVLIYQQFSHYL